jgi:hypothetical protein
MLSSHTAGEEVEVLNIDPVTLERYLVGGILAAAAVAVAFGPELSRVFVRGRSREAAAERESTLGAEHASS